MDIQQWVCGASSYGQEGTAMRFLKDNTEFACVVASGREFRWATVLEMKEVFSSDVLVHGTTSLCLIALPHVG